MTCTSAGGKPASMRRFARALDATVVLPLEPVVLMLISCSKMSCARWSFGDSGRGAWARNGTLRLIITASRQTRFISISRDSLLGGAVAPGHAQCLAHGGLLRHPQHDVCAALPAPSAGHRNERLGLGAHEQLLLLWRQRDHGESWLRVTERREDLARDPKIGGPCGPPRSRQRG